VLQFSNKFNLENIKSNKNVFISMTTIPERLKTDWFYNNLKNNLLNLNKNQCLIINIPYFKLNGEKYFISDKIKNLQNSNFIINRVKKDEGPITKILPSLRNNLIKDEDIIIICDDDLIYKELMFNILEENVIKFPEDISSMCNNTSYGFKNSIEGFKGFAFKKKILKNLLNYNYPNECIKVDDQIISFYINMNKIKVRSVPYLNNSNSFCSVIKDKNTPNWFELNFDNRIENINLCIKKLNNEYGIYLN
tara:strand:- start:403 stop:1152 length:750 start_codon:yes stop_codon:yes gene_type:complete